MGASIDIHFGENLEVLRGLSDESHALVYIDPPFNTGRTRRHTALRTVQDEAGDRTGFAGRRYRTEAGETLSYDDDYADLPGFLRPRLEEARRVLAADGALFVHLDWREVHYVKVLLDTIFGRASFLNEIVWAYDYGARSRRRWSAKHDTILCYVRDPKHYTFNHDAMDRIPYMAPGLVGPGKAARGKVPTDVWWHTIVPTRGHERTGYPTQKPLGVLNRIVRVHSNPGDRVLDFFAGSGTTGEAAWRAGRRCTLVDNNPDALRVMQKRFSEAAPRFHNWPPPESA